MSTKTVSFLAFVWFISTLICLVIEGTYWGSTQNTVLNALVGTSTMKVGGFVTIFFWGASFFQGVVKMLLWDYSFYTGGWEIMRYFWMIVTAPGIIWAMGSVFSYVFPAIIQAGAYGISAIAKLF